MFLLTIHPHFNTSHVTVYRYQSYNCLYQFSFQYISCYCLSTLRCVLCANLVISIHLMLLFILMPCNCCCCRFYFNTSHVTVYLEFLCTFLCIHSFQYISCYCLSVNGVYYHHSLPEFQYISCYCYLTS